MNDEPIKPSDIRDLEVQYFQLPENDGRRKEISSNLFNYYYENRGKKEFAQNYRAWIVEAANNGCLEALGNLIIYYKEGRAEYNIEKNPVKENEYLIKLLSIPNVKESYEYNYLRGAYKGVSPEKHFVTQAFEKARKGEAFTRANLKNLEKMIPGLLKTLAEHFNKNINSVKLLPEQEKKNLIEFYKIVQSNLFNIGKPNEGLTKNLQAIRQMIDKKTEVTVIPPSRSSNRKES